MALPSVAIAIPVASVMSSCRKKKLPSLMPLYVQLQPRNATLSRRILHESVRLMRSILTMELLSMRAIDGLIKRETSYYKELYKEKGLGGLLEELSGN